MNVIQSDKWKKRFLAMAYQASSWSKDESTQVGSVIVTTEGEPRSFGFNGMAVGVNDDVPERHERPEKYLWMEHAERNAIYLAEYPIRGCILFCTHIPCPDCARGIIQKRLSHVVIDRENGTKSDFWKDKHATTLTMLAEAGVSFEEIESDVTLAKIDGKLFVVPKTIFEG